jgi:hypothetical protein
LQATFHGFLRTVSKNLRKKPSGFSSWGFILYVVILPGNTAGFG